MLREISSEPIPHLAKGTGEFEPFEHTNDRHAEILQIVHDLKNPLATISLEMCLIDTTAVPADVRLRLSRVTQNIEFLDRLVQEILDASAVEADALHIQRRPTELRALLESTIDRAVSSRDRARVFLDAKRPLSLNIDDLRIERVVCNLLHNALKYSATASGVVVRLDQHDHFARVCVTDAGPGLTEGDKLVVFEKFKRACTAASHEGHGLGLYVSKQIVEAHGGTIGVESVRGVGSSFFFDLPLAS